MVAHNNTVAGTKSSSSARKTGSPARHSSAWTPGLHLLTMITASGQQLVANGVRRRRGWFTARGRHQHALRGCRSVTSCAPPTSRNNLTFTGRRSSSSSLPTPSTAQRRPLLYSTASFHKRTQWPTSLQLPGIRDDHIMVDNIRYFHPVRGHPWGRAMPVTVARGVLVRSCSATADPGGSCYPWPPRPGCWCTSPASTPPWPASCSASPSPSGDAPRRRQDRRRVQRDLPRPPLHQGPPRRRHQLVGRPRPRTTRHPRTPHPQPRLPTTLHRRTTGHQPRRVPKLPQRDNPDDLDVSSFAERQPQRPGSTLAGTQLAATSA
jgi:hypothetical protein